MESATLKCPKCDNDIVFHRRTCNVCEEPIGFPNVRSAKNEIPQLTERHREALAVSEAKNTLGIVKAFEEAVDKSHAIIARPLNTVIEMINNPSTMLATFMQAVASNARAAADNDWDRGRNSVENAIHPNYAEKMHYSVLSLNKYGVKYYGNSHIKLKIDYIENRTSVFEENGFDFFKKHKITIGQPVPKGYRATWEDRSKLAVAKLHSKILESTETSGFPEILISNDEIDFIEAQVYGSVSGKLFESITFVGLDAREHVLLNAYKSKIVESGVKFELE